MISATKKSPRGVYLMPLVAHESPKITELYDRTRNQITLDQVELRAVFTELQRHRVAQGGGGVWTRIGEKFSISS